MKTRLVKDVEMHHGSGNVFADLGLADAEKLKIKTGLVIEIRKAMKSRGLTQQEAAKLMGLTQPKVSGMMRGDFSNLSERKLMDCLTRLGYDIEIKVRPAKTEFDPPPLHHVQGICNSLYRTFASGDPPAAPGRILQTQRAGVRAVDSGYV